jgi:hypothetical protein
VCPEGWREKVHPVVVFLVDTNWLYVKVASVGIDVRPILEEN